jgi:hypothetical protein
VREWSGPDQVRLAGVSWRLPRVAAAAVSGRRPAMPPAVRYRAECTVLEFSQRRPHQALPDHQFADGMCKAPVSNERVALRSHDIQDEEVPLVPLQPRHEPRPQERLSLAPEGPRTKKSDSIPERRIPRSASSPRTICPSRPKNTAASTSCSGSHRRYRAVARQSAPPRSRPSAAPGVAAVLVLPSVPPATPKAQVCCKGHHWMPSPRSS